MTRRVHRMLHLPLVLSRCLLPTPCFVVTTVYLHTLHPLCFANALIRDRLSCEGMPRLESRPGSEPIVVEIKNRMSGFKLPPPFYDQLQTITYCLMR